MPVGFGFSVGDFIAALNLIYEVVDALKESGDSSTECRQLLRQLLALETALIHVKRLEPDDAQADQFNALKRSALQCRDTIDGFLSKISKYQPHLHANTLGTLATAKGSWYKVKWALCRKEDIKRFRADLVGHTEAINILMNAIQIDRLSLESKSQAERHSSLTQIIQSCYSKAMQNLLLISESVSTSLDNTKKLLAATTKIVQTDCRIFHAVLDIQELLRGSLTPQILRSQPVYFVDAVGTPAPFHLEFIRSSEAFVAVLRCNMKGNDAAIARIDRGDFAISDVATRQDINLGRPWHMCFRPGQRVDMSMILDDRHSLTSFSSSSHCPSCRAECTAADRDGDADVECQTCGLIFRRLTELGDDESSEMMDSQVPRKAADERKGGILQPNAGNAVNKRKREDDVAPELVLYRKVRLRQLQQTPSTAKTAVISITSYWSVPEQKKFPDLVKYYGQDFAAIAGVLKTKSPIMVKNYYRREIDAGNHKMKQDAAVAAIADAQQANRDRMGLESGTASSTSLRSTGEMASRAIAAVATAGALDVIRSRRRRRLTTK